ncbi:MAG: hypothetical protein M3P39_02120 [Actinomycetota bacterium]|nr:hypothetical protein [Actinomycetota bacterium]
MEREEHRRILGGHRVRLRVGPGHAKVPPAAPLPELDVAVRRVLRGDRKELEDTVKGLFEDDRRLPERLRDAAAGDLEARGLLRAQRTRVLGLVPRTRRSGPPRGSGGRAPRGSERIKAGRCARRATGRSSSPRAPRWAPWPSCSPRTCAAR